MTTKQQNTHRMWTTVRGTLASHENNNTWSGIAALVLGVEKFDEYIVGVAGQLEITALPNGAAAGKKAAFSSLVSSAHELAAALHAYATQEGNEELAAEVDFSVSALGQGRPATVVARATRIGESAAENLPALADYNITQEKLTGLTAKITAFEAVASRPRQMVARKAAANRAVPRLIAQGQKLLARRIDRLMVQFKESAPEFYAEYRTARKIVDQRGKTPGNVTSLAQQPELLKAA